MANSTNHRDLLGIFGISLCNFKFPWQGASTPWSTEGSRNRGTAVGVEILDCHRRDPTEDRELGHRGFATFEHLGSDEAILRSYDCTWIFAVDTTVSNKTQHQKPQRAGGSLA